MASAALATVRKELEASRNARAAALKRVKAKALELEGTALTVGAAAAAGVYEGRGNALPTIAGYDGKLVIGAAGVLAGNMLKGKTGLRVMNASAGLLAAGAYVAAKSGSMSSAGDETAGADWDI